MWTGKLRDGQYITDSFWNWWHSDDERQVAIQKQNKIVPWVHPDWYKGTDNGRTQTNVQHASGTTSGKESPLQHEESANLD